MAKLIGPIGSGMRGKVGQIVAAKTVGGDTAIRSYQPQVKNPNTLRQQAARRQLAVLSSLAAVFADAIAVGYSKAVSGMKMYGRNLFLSDSMKKAGLYNAGVVDYEKVPVSAKSGINVRPEVVTPGYNQSTGLTINFGVNVLKQMPNGNEVGIVLVMKDTQENMVEVRQIPTSTLVDNTYTNDLSDCALPNGANIYYFYKEILPTGTEIPTTDTPWKYPSATSESVFIGSVTW